jgi:rubrerythrin
LIDEATLEALLKISIRAEEAAMKLYEALADKFSHEKDVEEFWRSMLFDEIIHVQQLQKIYESLDQKKRAAQVDPAILQEAREGLRIVERADLDVIKNLDDAYELVSELENSEINTVFKFILARFAHTEVTRTFIDYELETHLKKLTEFAKRYDGSEGRKAVKVKV